MKWIKHHKKWINLDRVDVIEFRYDHLLLKMGNEWVELKPVSDYIKEQLEEFIRKPRKKILVLGGEDD